MKTLFVFDIDATILDVSKRYLKAGMEPDRVVNPEEHQKWVKRVVGNSTIELPVKGMVDMVSALSSQDLIFLTSRSESYRKVTTENLRFVLPIQFKPYQLIMREVTDNRPYSEYKEHTLTKYAQDYSAIVVFDDDPEGKLQEVCKKHGWTFFKACTGGFF